MRVEGNLLRAYVEEKIEGELQVIIDGGIRSARGATLGKTQVEKVSFAIEKPQIRWVGNGVILPETFASIPLSVAFEAVNLRTVRVTAFIPKLRTSLCARC